MKILVVGHLCLDTIHQADGSEMQSYGGIYYSVVTLATLLGKADRVVPVFGVNRNDFKPLLDDLSRFPNIDPSGLFKFDEPTNHVHLFYETAHGSDRIECSTDISRPIPYARISPYLSVDGILINMVSGSDITVDTLDEIRMAVRDRRIPIHFDYHSVTLGVNEKQERFRRPLSDWRRWAFMTDTVQLNEEEIAGLPLEKLTEEQTVGHALTLGPKAVLVTRGSRGVSVFWNDHKRVRREDVPGIPVASPRDTTGCGDVFGAAFHLQYVRTEDLVGAATYANRVAAAKVEFAGAAALEQLRQVPVPSEPARASAPQSAGKR